MRSLSFNTAQFIKEYHQAADAGLTHAELAILMGVSYACLSRRKHALSKRGIRLPSLVRKAGTGRPAAARPLMRLIAPVEVKVEPKPLVYVIEVGG